MAEEVINTRIVANADFSSLIADVHRVTASLSKLQEQLSSSNKMLANNVAAINRNFADTLRSTGQYSSHFVSLTSNVEKFGNSLDTGRLKLKDYFGAYQSHIKTSGGLIRDLAKQQVAMQNAILQPLGRNAQGLQQFNVHIPRGIDAIKNKTALASQELKIMNKVIQDGAVQLINWGKNTQWAGRQLTVGLTLPLSAFGKAAADAFKNADQELTRLTKVYGGVAATSTAELKKIRAEVTATAAELAKQYGASFQDTISLAADIAATGKQGNELLASTKETTRLAVLGEVDRQDAMKATLALQTAFKQNTQQLSESINFLNAVENQTSTSLGDLIEAIPKAGPVIQGLGGSVKDLALYLTAMREGGISAAEGANALKSGLASLINPTNKAVDQFKSFGIDLLGIVSKNAGNVTGTLLELQSALDKLNPLQKQQAIENLFGKFQFARMNALFENLGKQGSQTLQVLDLMKASTADLANIAGRELAQVTESASGKYRRALESLKADLAGVGEQFLTVGTKLINIVDKALQFFEKLPKPVKTALTFIAGLTALAGPLIMLTGLLANFFGYVVKGAMHMKAFLKGGEGWKYLTPEMLAAEKAGKLVEQTFYSDAKAASILQLALKNLIDEFSVLEAKAKAGSISVQPAVSTMAGNIVMASGGRVVDPNNPLAGPYGTRASTHMVPRASLSEEQRMQQTMFGFVPGAIPVNRKIGNNPQIYMNEELPNVPGLTRIGGTSTGVISSEAAKWHAMQATLGMQSKQELDALKKEIATTGLVSKDFMNTFETILPSVTAITDNAASESAAIVAEFRSGKINLEQARAKIIALNAEVEQLLAQTTTELATGMGRTLNPTMVPTLNQPVVDPTGKSNMRELFKKGKTRSFINRVAGALGVRTSGAGYNIETTIPKKFATGNLVPGNGSSDTVPAMLTPGEFVVNKQATANNLPLLMAINGQGSGGPGYNTGSNGAVRSTQYEDVLEPRMSGVTSQEMRGAFGDRFRGNRSSYRLRGTAGVYLNTVTDPAIVSRYSYLSTDGRTISVEAMNARMAAGGLPSQVYEAAMAASRHAYSGSSDQLLHTLATNGIITSQEATSISSEIDRQFRSDIRRQVGVRDANNRYWAISNRVIQSHLSSNPRALGFWNKFSSEPAYIVSESLRSSGEPMRSPSMELRTLTHDNETIKIDPLKGVRGQSFFAHARTPTPLLTRLMEAGITTMGRRALPFRFSRRNNGGIIGLNSGGMVPGYKLGGAIQNFKSGYQSGRTPMEGKEFDPNSGMMTSMAGFGAMTAGQFIPGPIGQGLQMAGIAMQFAPMLKMIGNASKGFLTLGTTVTKFGSIAGRVALIASNAFKLMTGPVGIAIGLMTAAFALWKKHQNDVLKNRENETAMFGLSKKGASELGIQYTTITEKMKAVREEQKLMADNARAKFEAYTSAGVTGISLTIKQLKDLKEQVKTSMPDMLKTLNNLDSSQVTQWASNVKAQMIAAGKSVQDANNLIYALIESSNKAGMGVAALTDKAFSSIQDKGTAAAFTMKTLADNFDKVASIDSKAFASNLDTAVASADALLNSLVGTKDANGKIIDQSAALKKVYDDMEKSGIKSKKISEDVLATIQKERPELAAILNKSDTIGGMYAKWRLALSGVDLDLKKLSSAQAEMLSQFQSGLDAAAAAALTVGNNLSGVPNVATVLKGVNEAQVAAAKKAQAATNGQLGANKTLIKQYQDQIKLIRDTADAKKKALQDTLDAENTQAELQKLQLDYQAALARGDKDAANQAQLSIRQLTKQFEVKKAMDKIDQNAKAAEAVQQGLIDKENAKDGTAATTGASNQKIADRLAATAATITKLANTYTSLGKDLADANMMTGTAKTKAMDTLKNNFSTFMTDLVKAANSDPKVAEAFSNLLTKNAKGQYEAKGTYTSVSPTGTTYTTSGAFDQLKTLSESMTTFAKDLMGKNGISLSEIDATLKAGFKIGSNKALNISAASLTSLVSDKKTPYSSEVDYADLKKGILDKEGFLKEEARQLIILANKLQEGDQFTYAGTKYGVKIGEGSWMQPRAVRMSSGGFIRRAVNGITGMMGSSPYLVGERGPELFIPSGGGQIIPNNMLGINSPRYNVPSNTVTGIRGGANNSYNNNVYNIDIALNGTNVTADDVMRKFKAELALINAREGRVRTVGGTV